MRLFTASGTVEAAVTYLREVAPLTREEEELVEGFHRHLVTTVLAPGAGLAWEGAPAPLLLPLLGDTPDLDLCARVARYGGAPERAITLRTDYLAKCKGESFYYDQVVFDRTRAPGATSPTHYFVEEVDLELTAATVPMPGLATSYLEHLQQQHGRTLRDPQQPMVRIASAKRKDFMIQVSQVWTGLVL